MKERVTVRDVAKKAGVSQPTVSRVLNNYMNVKPATKAKVLRAIEETGFVPNAIARSLVRNKTNTIGLIVGDISNPFYAETAKVIIEKAQTFNYEIILLDTNHKRENLEKYLNILVAKQVDGIIVASVTRFDRNVEKLSASGFPIILYNRNVKDKKNVNYIELDNEKGAMLAMKHLVELGHRNISYIAGPMNYSTFHYRYLGYMSAVRKFQLRHEKEFIYEGPMDYDEVLSFAQNVMKREDRPSSFFVVTDQMAIAVLDAAARCNLRVPHDVSIVGFDNINIAQNKYISLTTVSQQKKKMALLALENLIDLIEGKARSRIQIVLEPELIAGKTSGPCPQ